ARQGPARRRHRPGRLRGPPAHPRRSLLQPHRRRPRRRPRTGRTSGMNTPTTLALTPAPGAARRLAWAASDAAAVAGRNLRHIPRVPEKLAMVSFQPIIFVLLFGYLFGSAITVPGGNYRQFVVAGIFTQMMVLGASTTASASPMT